MCVGGRPTISAAAPIIANPGNAGATRQADIEARLRRARLSSAASVLTSPTGIPATAKLGNVQ